MQGNEPEIVLAIFPLLPVVLGAATAGLGAMENTGLPKPICHKGQ